MFDFLKKRAQSEAELKALADGEMIPLSDVKDEMFSQKIMGDGVEILIHIGIDTVSLNGEGFDVRVKQGEYVRQGEVLCTVDPDIMESRGIDTTTMMIFTDLNGKTAAIAGHGKVKGKETTAAVIK